MNSQVVFIADSLDNAHKFQQVLSHLDLEVFPGSSLQTARLLGEHNDCALLIYEACGRALPRYEEFLPTIEKKAEAILVIAEPGTLSTLHLPTQIPSDFVINTASPEECMVRVGRLLASHDKSTEAEKIVVDNMVIDLATYQVKVNGTPLDLTYLEYALLSFLATHPLRTFSRDVLLQRVWGFDYFGGSRTVDVHVRRIRAKLGPDLAQHLETVRGIGYLWSE
ncbi:MAG: winged helix-turn-helix domain-containing protein [Eggerthellaceae bacterium]|jgi:DNA-binding response OmpR family regulator